MSSSGVFGDEELLHARETYRPRTVLPTGEMAFGHWTERVEANSDTVSARELAGLTDEQLAALASEFEKAPRRRRVDPFRFSSYISAGLAVLSVVGAIAEALTPGKAAGFTPWVAFSVVTGGLASLAFLASVFQNYRMVSLEMAYGKLGLLVGRLDEQHPWLYKTYLLQRHPAAASYRAQVLSERGALRGADYVMMREVADRHDGLELTKTAREVSSLVQTPN